MPVSEHTQVTHGVARTLYAMLLVSVLLGWLNQDSITLYCQQRYHQSCELPGLGQSSLWRAGAEMNAALAAGRDGFLASLDNSRDRTEGPALVELPAAMPVVTVDVSQGTARLTEADALPLLPAAETPPVALASLPAPTSTPVPAPAQPATPLPMPATLPPTVPAPTPSTGVLATLAEGDEVFLVGDSLMQGVAPHLANSLLRRHKIRSLNLSRQSTGLAYPGFFNWPRTVSETLANHPAIRLMVVFLGPNDPWDMPQGKGKPFLRFKSPQWEQQYRARIDAILEQAHQHRVQVIWVGPPNMSAARLSTAMTYLSGLYQQQTEAYGQHFVSANPFLGYPDEQYAATVQNEQGTPVKVRVDDGIHFTITGQKLIAARILALIGFSGLAVTGH